jgi:hypothetical protein
MALYNELQPGFVPGGDDDDDDAIDPDIFAAAAFKHGLFFPPVGRVAQVRDRRAPRARLLVVLRASTVMRALACVAVCLRSLCLPSLIATIIIPPPRRSRTRIAVKCVRRTGTRSGGAASSTDRRPSWSTASTRSCLRDRSRSGAKHPFEEMHQMHKHAAKFGLMHPSGGSMRLRTTTPRGDPQPVSSWLL